MSHIKNKFIGFKKFIFKHKITAGIIFIVLIGAIFLAYKFLTPATTQTKYILTKAEKGTIVSSLSSSGQVSALNQIDIKAKASGDVTYVGVKAGDNVRAGSLIAMLDTTDAEKSVRDAESNLQSAQISLQKLLGTDLSNPTNKQEAEATLVKDYESGYNTVANAFIDLPTIMTGLDSILYGSTFNSYQQNIDYYYAYTFDETALQYKNSADSSYKKAKLTYNESFNDYKATSRFSDNSTIDSVISGTYEATKNIAQAIKDTNNLIQFYEDTLTTKKIPINSIADVHLSSLSSYLSKANSNLSNLLNAQSTIKSDIDAISNAGLDAQSQQLSLEKSKNTLADAKAALADYYVYAPFDGVIATIDAKAGQAAPSPIATIISKTLVAEISFGETDIAKIKIGQKSTLTFDAVPDLTITGKVSAIDVIGASSQGVVSYNVKVVMDLQNNNIKPGMSTTATIITDTKTDALYVPNSAVKTQQGTFYVLKVAETVSDADIQNTSGTILKTVPARQTVETGVSDDSSTEIISGLSEGDVVVFSTVSSTATTKTASSSSKSTTNSGPGGGGMGIPGL